MKAGRLLAILAVIVVALEWLGAFFPGPHTWGFHHWAFLPRPLLAFVGGVAIALLLPPLAGGVAGALGPLARGVAAGRRAVAPVAIVLAVFAAAFWLGRQRLFLLSDGELLVRLVERGMPNLAFTADTLGALIQLWANVLLVDILEVSSVTASFRLVAIVSGLVWLVAMFRTVARLVPDGWGRVALGGLLATAGVTRLFYGYVETGPLLAAAVALFLWAGVRLAQEGRGVVPLTLAFLLAAAMHVTGLLLAPAWLWLLWRWARAAPGRMPRAVALLAAPVVLYLAIFFLLGGSSQAVGNLYAPYFGKFLRLFGEPDAKRAYTLLSPARWTEFLNEQFLLGPFALIALAAIWALVPPKDRPAGPEVNFLLAVLGPFLVLSVLFNRELGGARDWDLVANLAVPAILLVGLAFVRGPGFSPALAVTLIAASLFHLAGFVLVDADRDRSMRHFLALFGEGAPVSRFARSYALEEVALDEIDRGRIDEAIGHLTAAATIDPANVKARGTLGSLLNSRGESARAIPYLREVVKLRPDLALGHYNLGAAHMTAGQPGEAAVEFEEALRLDPNLEPAWLGLANMALALDMTVQADSVARKGLERFPNNADLMTARAVAREKAGRPTEAITLLEAARVVAPDNRPVLFNLGRLYNAAGNYAGGASALERLTALDPADAEAWNNLGVARLQLGQLDAAGRAFVGAINADPNLVPAYMNLAQVLFQQARYEEAMGTLQSFIDRNPDAGRRAGMDVMLDLMRRRAAGGAP